MTELQLKVIEELEANYGWSDIVDDVSISMELLKDTVRATEKVVKNLTIPDVSFSEARAEVCEHVWARSADPFDLSTYCTKCGKFD
jgi:hypothetical protein